MNFDVWSEGYAATGESGGAVYHGQATAASFREACVKVLGRNELFDPTRLTYWGCRLFPTEEEARRSFG